MRTILTLPANPRISAAVLAAVVLMMGCGGAVRGGVGSPPGPAIPAQLSAVERARADSIRRPYTAADIYFMSAMIGHHAQALVMAGWAATHDAGPEVKRLAERIINAQKDEILTMQTWLANRNLPVPEANPMGLKHLMNGVEHVMLMPGMLTEEQMRELDRARGREFDRLFLLYMMQHHRGAVGMVKDLFASYGAGQDETVFKFASDVNVDQTTEIDRMQKMLAALTLGVTLP